MKKKRSRNLAFSRNNNYRFCSISNTLWFFSYHILDNTAIFFKVKYIISKCMLVIARSAINCRWSSRCNGSSTFQQLDEQCTLGETVRCTRIYCIYTLPFENIFPTLFSSAVTNNIFKICVITIILCNKYL